MHATVPMITVSLSIIINSSSGAAASDSAATLREGAKKLRDSLGIGRVHSDDGSDSNNNHTNNANNAATTNSGYASDSSIGAASGLSSHKGTVTPNSPTSDSPVSPGLGQFLEEFFTFFCSAF
jgi:hypothetical protein